MDASGKVTGLAAGGPVTITLTDTTTGCFAEARVTVLVPPPCTLSQITPGDTRYFQAWTRDVLCGPPPAPCPSPCAMNSNLSSGAVITFTP